MMGHIRLSPGGAVRGQAAAQDRKSLRRITILDLDPSATDRSVRAPEGKTLLGGHPVHLIYPLTEDYVIFEEQAQHRAASQGQSQRRQMSKSPSLGYGCLTLC